MKLLIIGGSSPTGRALTKLLRLRKVEFQAPPDRHFGAENPRGVERLVSAYQPTQLINLTDFISGNHRALWRAETMKERCVQVNAALPVVLTQIARENAIPLLHLSNSYVFDGAKRLSYNETDEVNPQGVYGDCTLAGERAVRQHERHIVLRSGWLFGEYKKSLIKAWLRAAKRADGAVPIWRRRFSPTYTGDLARVILAISQQVDCEAPVWGTYHYSGLEAKRESEFLRQVLHYAVGHDPQAKCLLDKIKLDEREVRAPEIANSTFSSKKLFDTFGIKQRSWHQSLRETIASLYGEPCPSAAAADRAETPVAAVAEREPRAAVRNI